MQPRLRRKVPHECKPPSAIVRYETYTEPGKWPWSKPVEKKQAVFSTDDMFYRCEHGAEWFWRGSSMFPYWSRVKEAPEVWEDVPLDELEQP